MERLLGFIAVGLSFACFYHELPLIGVLLAISGICKFAASATRGKRNE